MTNLEKLKDEISKVENAGQFREILREAVRCKNCIFDDPLLCDGDYDTDVCKAGLIAYLEKEVKEQCK